MKLDSKENLIVRAGTGFVTVQEFLKVFLPAEVEKLKKTPAFKNLSSKMEKIQSYLCSLTNCIKAESTKSSPTLKKDNNYAMKKEMNA